MSFYDMIQKASIEVQKNTLIAVCRDLWHSEVAEIIANIAQNPKNDRIRPDIVTLLCAKNKNEKKEALAHIHTISKELFDTIKEIFGKTKKLTLSFQERKTQHIDKQNLQIIENMIDHGNIFTT
jgi:hypothetical protein